MTTALATPKTMSIVQARISTDVKKQVKIALNKNGLTLNDLIRISINNFLEDQETITKSSTSSDLTNNLEYKILQARRQRRVGKYVSFDNSQAMDNYFDNL